MRWLLYVCCCAAVGCLQSDVPINNTKPRPPVFTSEVSQVIAQQVLRERMERSALALSISKAALDGVLSTPEAQGKAWNDEDIAISKRTSAAISTALKSAFAKQPADLTWFQVSEGYKQGGSP